MELSNGFLQHLNKIGYTQDINSADIQHVAQGVVKPILQFFMQIIVDPKSAKKIKGNLKIFDQQSTDLKKPEGYEEIKRLQNISTQNYLKIKRLKDQIKSQRAKQMIINGYKENMKKIKDKIKDFQKDLKISKKEDRELNPETVDSIGESLLYIINEDKTALINEQKITRLSLNYDLNSVKIFPIITEKIKTLQNNLLEKIKNFSPEEEFLYLGVSLKKENGIYKIEEVDNNTVIDRLNKEISEKRENIWNEFEKTEGIIEEAEKLKEKLRNLMNKQVVINPNIKKLQSLLINISSKKAELEYLKKGSAELKLKLQEIESKNKVSQNHSKNLGETESISSKISEYTSKNSAIRREILKKKLQIEEFFKRHFFVLKSSISKSLNPLYKPFHNEIKGFELISNTLLPLNVPSGRKTHSEEQFSPIFNQTHLTSRLLSLTQTLETQNFLNPEELSKKIESSLKSCQKIEEIYSVQEKPLPNISKQKSIKGILDELKSETNQVSEMVKDLHSDLSIWHDQPAQHLIPWKKEHIGLNISESLELWKSSIIDI